jgi:hypothetical protein
MTNDELKATSHQLCFNSSFVIRNFEFTSSTSSLPEFPLPAQDYENKGGKAEISGNMPANVRSADTGYARAPKIWAFAWLWLSCNFLPQ